MCRWRPARDRHLSACGIPRQIAQLEGERAQLRQLQRDGALILLAALFAVPTASAQTGGVYELTWTTLDGGGGNAAGSPYAVSATIGQHDAGILSGGAYVLEGGFWNTMTPANNPPTLGTVTPSALTSMPGIAQKLSAVYSDPDGYGNLDQVSFPGEYDAVRRKRHPAAVRQDGEQAVHVQ